MASRNKTEIAELGEEVIIERNAKREIRGQLIETTADLANTRIAKEKLKKEAKQITADLVAERKLKRELKTQMADCVKFKFRWKSSELSNHFKCCAKQWCFAYPHNLIARC